MLNEVDPQVKALLEQFQANAARHPAPATPLSQKEKIMATREMITVVIHGRDEARASAVAREIRDPRWQSVCRTWGSIL
jgi:hypothetical protein